MGTPLLFIWVEDGCWYSSFFPLFLSLLSNMILWALVAGLTTCLLGTQLQSS